MPKQQAARGRLKKNWMERIRKAMNERNLNEGQWEDRKQWSLGVGQRTKKFWNWYIYVYIYIYIYIQRRLPPSQYSIYATKCYPTVLCYLPSFVGIVTIITLYRRTKILVFSSIRLRYEQTVRTLGWKVYKSITNTPSKPQTASYRFALAGEVHRVAETLTD